MALETCFVVMAIGDQQSGGGVISAAELRRKYDDLIKEALLRAAPTLEIVRADDIAAPGSITSDIITRLMHSTFVIADVTFPNPNVYYELGLRHACRTGTVIIRDRSGPKVPFDIAHLRHIEYDNTSSGLKDLADRFRTMFAHFTKDPSRPDNQFQELAKLTSYRFPDYAPSESADAEIELIMAVLNSPKLLELLMRAGKGEEVDQAALMSVMASNPEIAKLIIKGMVKSGKLSLFSPTKRT